MMANGRLKKMVLAGVAVLAVTGCAREGAIDLSSGVGISVIRSGCPAVAVPDHTGDITIFNPASSTDASAIDVVAYITNVRTTCNSESARIYSEAAFDVHASRMNPAGARTVTIPYFSTVVQGGTAVVAKRVGNVTLQFADGAYRATAAAKAGSYVDASAARLPDEVIERLTRRRKAGDPDAALDPLADPTIKAAVARSSFEMLVGFQLSQAQLQYNATR